MLSILISMAYLWPSLLILYLALGTAWGPTINKYSANAELFAHYYDESTTGDDVSYSRGGHAAESLGDANAFKDDGMGPRSRRRLVASPPLQTSLSSSFPVEEGFYTATNVGRGQCGSAMPQSTHEMGSKGACIPTPFRCSRGVVDLRLDSLIAETTPPSLAKAEEAKEECELKRAATSYIGGGESCGHKLKVSPPRKGEQHNNAVTARVSALMDALLNISDSYNTKALVAGLSVFSMASGTPKAAAQAHSLAGRSPRRNHNHNRRQEHEPSSCNGEGSSSRELLVEAHLGIATPPKTCRTPEGSRFVSVSMAVADAVGERVVEMGRSKIGTDGNPHAQPSITSDTSERGRGGRARERDDGAPEDNKNQDEKLLSTKRSKRRGKRTVLKEPRTRVVDTIGGRKTVVVEDEDDNDDSEYEDYTSTSGEEEEGEHPQQGGKPITTIPATAAAALSAGITTTTSDGACGSDTKQENDKALCNVQNPASEIAGAPSLETTSAITPSSVSFDHLSVRGISTEDIKLLWTVVKRVHEYVSEFLFCSREKSSTMKKSKRGESFEPFCSSEKERRRAHRIGERSLYYAPPGFYSKISADAPLAGSGGAHNSNEENYWSLRVDGNVHGSHAVTAVLFFDSSSSSADDVVDTPTTRSSTINSNDERIPFSSGIRRASLSSCGEEDIHEHDHHHQCVDDVADMCTSISAKEKYINRQEPSSSSFSGGTFEFGLPSALSIRGSSRDDGGDNDDGLSVAPKAGRLLIFTSGKENMYHRTRVKQLNLNQLPHPNSVRSDSSLYLRSLTTAFTCDKAIGVKVGSHFEADGSNSSLGSSGGGKGNGNNNFSSSRGGPTDLYRVLETAIRHDPDAFRALQESTLSAVEEEARQARRAQEEKKRELPTETVVGKHRVFVRKVGSDDDDDDADDYEDEVDYGKNSGESITTTTTDDVVLDEEGGVTTDSGN